MRHSLADRRCDGAREELNNFRRTLVAVLWIGNILPLDDRKSYPVWCEKAAEARSVLVESPK